MSPPLATVSVDFLICFWTEAEPSAQVVWLWKSPAAYLPAVTADAVVGVTVAAAARAAATANAIFVVFTLMFPSSF